MSITFDRHQGTSPLLISIPHDGRRIPPRMADRMTEEGTAMPDTDWHVRKLYEFARLSGASILSAKYSRYVVDLNRPPDNETLYDDRIATGLFPQKTFAGDHIYKDGETLTQRQKNKRLTRYWQPWHDELGLSLAHIRDHFGYALLWDAHSIRSNLPLMFDTLPELNIGTNDGRSCPPDIEHAVANVAAASPFSAAVNARFKGGYITRHYGRPEEHVYALQLELAQRCYMNEETLRYDDKRAAVLCDTLSEMLSQFQASAASAMGTAGGPR